MLQKPPQLPMRNKASSKEPGYSVTSPYASFSYCLKLLYSSYVNSVNQLLQSSSVFHYNLRDCIFNYGRSSSSTLPYKHIFCLCSPKNCYLKGRRRGLGEEKKEPLRGLNNYHNLPFLQQSIQHSFLRPGVAGKCVGRRARPDSSAEDHTCSYWSH